MKESILNKIQICKQCKKAFQPGLEGDDDICDVCIDSAPKDVERYDTYGKTDESL